MVRRIGESAAGEHRAVRVRIQGVPPFAPVDEIPGDGVAPVHIPPVQPRRIVLIEHMVDAVRVGQPVRIVDPAVARGEMDHRTVRGVVAALPVPFRRENGGIGQRIVEIGGRPVDGGIPLDGEGQPVEPPQIDEHGGCGGILRRVGDVKVIDQRAASVGGDLIKQNFGIGLGFDNGQHKVPICGAAGMQHGVLLFDIPHRESDVVVCIHYTRSGATLSSYFSRDLSRHSFILTCSRRISAWQVRSTDPRGFGLLSGLVPIALGHFLLSLAFGLFDLRLACLTCSLLISFVFYKVSTFGFD